MSCIYRVFHNQGKINRKQLIDLIDKCSINMNLNVDVNKLNIALVINLIKSKNLY